MINIQNIDDDEFFKWSIVRYLNLTDHNPRRITKAEKDIAKKLDFKDIKFPLKVRDIHKIEKKNSIGISVFGYENKEKHVDLLLREEEGKKHYVLIKDFNTFTYDLTLHRDRKHFCRYCLQAFITEKILKRHIKDCFKINDKQKMIMPKTGEYVKLKNYERKIKSPFIIYADFESVLVPEDNGKQNSEESYTKKYQKHIACSYGYKLVCVDDKFSKHFTVYNFVNSMIEESRYCSEVIKKLLKKDLLMTKEDNEDFKNSTKCWVCDNDYVDSDVKDHCHITGKYRGPAHRDCNINLKLNHKIPVVFHNLKNMILILLSKNLAN